MAVHVPVDIDVDGDTISEHIDADARRARAAAAASGRGAGAAFGDGFFRDANGRLRAASGRFASDAEKAMIEGGDKSGRGWAGAFSKRVRRDLDFGSIVPEFRFRVGPLAALLAAVAPLAPAFGAATAAIIPATAALSSFGLTAAAVGVGMQGLGDAFKAQGKVFEEIRIDGEASAESMHELDVALRRLHPNARAFVKEAVAIAPAWSKVRKEVQGNLFAGTAESLRSLADSILPVLSTNLQGVARDLNLTARGWVDSITSAEGVEKTTKLLEGMRTVLQDLTPAVGNLVVGLLNLFGASLGPGAELSQTLLDLSERFRAWSDQVASNGSFAEFLRGAMDVFGTLLDVVVDLGAALGTLFTAATGDSVGMLGVIADVAQAFRDFTADAPEGLQRVLGVLLLLAPAATLLTGPLLSIVAGVAALSGPALVAVGAAAALAAAFGVFIAAGGDVGPLMSEIGDTIDVVREAFNEILPTIQEVGGQILDAFVPAMQSVVDTVTEDLLPAIQAAIPVITKIGAVLIQALGPTVVATITALGNVFRGIVQIIAGVINTVVGLLTGDWSRAWSGIVGIVRGVISVLTGVVQAFFGSILGRIVRAGLNGVLGIVRTVFGGIRGAFVAGWSAVNTIVRNGVTTVVNGIAALPGRLLALGGRLREAGKSIIKSFVSGMSNAAGIISGIAGNVWDALRGLINGAISKINSALEFTIDLPGPKNLTINPPNIPHLARGTNYFPGGLALVGEQGPELAILPRGSQVKTASETRALARNVNGGGNGGGTTVAISQNYYGPTTSGGRLRELDWTLRYATRARNNLAEGLSVA